MHFLICLAIVLVLFRFFPVTMLVLGTAFVIFVGAIMYQNDVSNAKFNVQEASRLAYLQTHKDLQGWVKPYPENEY